MIISIGFIRSASQVLLKELYWQENKIESKLIDITDIQETHFQAILIDESENIHSLISLLETEKAFYPIVQAKEENITYEQFETISSSSLRELYLRLQNRWALYHNLNSIEKSWDITHHFRDLWTRDRLTFFEECWYWLKRNLSTVELTIIFNDVIKSEEKDENNEKKLRPKLVQSTLSGTKKAHFKEGSGKEKELMQSYLKTQSDVFEVTEFNPSKGQFVAVAQIDKSPMIFMARMTQLSQLQRSVLLCVFNGLKSDL